MLLCCRLTSVIHTLMEFSDQDDVQHTDCEAGLQRHSPPCHWQCWGRPTEGTSRRASWGWYTRRCHWGYPTTQVDWRWSDRLTRWTDSLPASTRYTFKHKHLIVLCYVTCIKINHLQHLYYYNKELRWIVYSSQKANIIICE